MPVYSVAGEVVKHIEISDDVFGVPFNGPVVHQAMVRQLANARQGTASTKTRGDVSGSRAKLFRQKSTGMARAGSRMSPLRRGGGVTFGPKPRSYTQAMPKKMRRLALKCVLSAKAVEGELRVVEQLEFEKPRTKEMKQILTALGVDSSILIVTSESETNIIKSSNNLSKVDTIPANLLNVVDILSYKMLLMTEAAVRKAEQIWGQGLSPEVTDASL